MFLGLLFFAIALITPVSAYAGVSVNWSDTSNSSAHQKDQIDMNVNLSGLSVGSTYYVGVKGGPNSGDCYILLKNGYNGCNGFNAGNLYSVTQDGILTLRFYAQGASGSYQVYSYVYDSSGALLDTSDAKTISISDAVPTSTPTLTPTITPTATITPTLKPTATVTKYLTPTPMLPTPEPLITDVPVVSLMPTITPINISSPPSEENPGSALPFILIFLGIGLFAAPLLAPKIIAKIKSGKKPPSSPPPVEPPTEIPDERPSTPPPVSPPVTLIP